jgi:TPR repeat protein
MANPVSEIEEAKEAIESADYERAASLLDRLISQGNAEAMYLRAQFGFAEESQDMFVARRVSLLMQSAILNHPDALYEMSIHLETGDGVPVDQAKAIDMLHRAATLGHPNALWQIGKMYLYGTGSQTKNVATGLELIEKAAGLGSQGALWSLADFYSEGKFGYPKNSAEAARLREASEADDVVRV